MKSLSLRKVFSSLFISISVLIVGTVFLVQQLSPAQAQTETPDIENEIGYGEFRLHCAVCHGVDGTGTGSIAGLLNVTADKLDLTDIAAKNNGEYPFRIVYQVIDGRKNVAAHGERLMPVWGDRYSLEAGEKYGPYGSKAVINGRILELVYFIQSIQQ